MRPRLPQQLLVGLVASLGLCSASRAHASGGAWDFRPQFKLSANALIPEAEGFGGVELHASASILGFGLILAGGWERAALMPGAPDGGYALVQVQVCPLTWTSERTFAIFNPYVAVGGLLGGLDPGVFRAGLAASVGFDLTVFPADDFETRPAITFEFRGVAPGTPEDAAQWFLVVGLGARLAH